MKCSAESAWSRLRGHFLLATAALAATVMVGQFYAKTVAVAEQDRQRLQTCRQLAAEVIECRGQPAFAASEVLDLAALTNRIAAAREQANLEESLIDLVDPRPAERLRESSYLVRPVAIALRGLTLRQAVTLMYALAEPEYGLWVSQLRLSPTRRETEADALELWNVEILLTQLVFSPIVKSPSPRPFH